jgi:hypothetical protein
MRPLLAVVLFAAAASLAAAALPATPARAAQLAALDTVAPSRLADVATSLGKSSEQLRELVSGGAFRLNQQSLTAHYACTFGREAGSDAALLDTGDPLAADAMALTASLQSLLEPGLGDPDSSQAFKLHRWAKCRRLSCATWTGDGSHFALAGHK